MILNRYGVDAEAECAARAHYHKALIDPYGERVWLRIGAAVTQLRANMPVKTMH